MSPFTLILFVCFTQLLLVHSEITDLTCADDEALQKIKISWKKSGVLQEDVFGSGPSGSRVIAMGRGDGVVFQWKFVPSVGGENGHWVLKHGGKVLMKYCHQMLDEIKNALSNPHAIAIKIGTHMVKGTKIVLINENARTATRTASVVIRFTDIHGERKVHKINSDSTEKEKTITIGANRYLFRNLEPDEIQWMEEREGVTSFKDTDYVSRSIMHHIGLPIKITIGSDTVQNGETIKTKTSKETPKSISKPAPVESAADESHGTCECISEDECDLSLHEEGEAPYAHMHRHKLEAHIATHVSPVDYEFYGSKTSKEGGIERSGDEIKCNGVEIFIRDKSKHAPETEPWNWNWQLTGTGAAPEVYAHIDGLIFMNLKTKRYVQLLPKTKMKLFGKGESIQSMTGCVMTHAISYTGRWWAFENGDLANYNLYMWTMGDTRVVDTITTSHSDMFCNGNHEQHYNYCQLYAQNNVLQYEVDNDKSYAAFSYEQLGVKKKLSEHKAKGYSKHILVPGLKRFGVTRISYDRMTEPRDTPKMLTPITPQYMQEIQCIGVVIKYIIWIPPNREKDFQHYITYKYLRGQGWYALDANVNDPMGPFETLLAAEEFANNKQLKSWRLVGKWMSIITKDGEYFKEKYKSKDKISRAAAAKQEMYDDVTDVMNYENGYETYESKANYGSGNEYSSPVTDIENVLWGVSMEIMILVLLLCCGFICIGFICSCVGFSVCYLLAKYQQNVKMMPIQNQSSDEEEYV